MPASPFLLDRGHLCKYSIATVKTGMIWGGGGNPKQTIQEGRKEQGREIITKHWKREDSLKMRMPLGLSKAQWAVQEATEAQSPDWIPSIAGVYLLFGQRGAPNSPPRGARRFPAVQPLLHFDGKPLLFSLCSWISILISNPTGQQNQIK